MQNAPILRPLNPDDAEQLRALYALSLQKNAAGFVTNPGFHGDIFARAEKYRAENGAFLGLFDDGRLVGFGGLKAKEEGRVELCNLHLHPECQGQGQGKRLALALIDEARELKYDIVELHVTVTQEKAIGLYRRLGFTDTRRKVYDVEGKSFDTLFMELSL